MLSLYDIAHLKGFSQRSIRTDLRRNGEPVCHGWLRDPSDLNQSQQRLIQHKASHLHVMDCGRKRLTFLANGQTRY
jgi:hypothetical protein